MQVQTRQQTSNPHIQSMNQAVLTMQEMSEERQRKVFDYIELLCFYDGVGLVNDDNKAQEKPKKRQFGICRGKGSFVMKDDFEMTEEELINL